MVRDNNKIYAEINDPERLTASGVLREDCLVFRLGGPREVQSLATNGIRYVGLNGVETSLGLEPNKTMGTDASGNLVWLDF